MSLWQDFLINDKKQVHKWAHYFPIYERHFSRWRDRSMTLWEIGVAGGGSLQMWQRYFGPLARIVGIDIDPSCSAHESLGIAVRIGHQADSRFLQAVIDEFGVPDVVLDDGSHEMSDMQASFYFLYPRMDKNAVYMLEDLHTAYWAEYGGGTDRADADTFIGFAKSCVDRLNADHSRGAIVPDVITKETFSISFYDSVVVFEKGHVWWKSAPKTGRDVPGVQPT